MNQEISVFVLRAARVAAAAGFLALLAGCGGGSAEGGDPPDPVPTVTLSASPTEVDSGATTTLSWSSTNATSCSASGGWSGNKGTSGSEASAALTADTTFTLTCQGAGGQTVRAVTVTIAAAPAPSLSFAATPNPVSFNTVATLSWTARNVDICEASGAWSGRKVLEGQAEVGPLTEDSEFILTCSGTGGSVSESVTVGVAAPSQPGLAFTVSPDTVAPNGAATLTWNSIDANTCTASGGWSGNQSLNGSASTGPLTQPTSFTLTCANNNGSVARTVNVDVSSATGGQKLVSTFRLTDSASGAGRPVTIGVPLPQGEVAAGADLVVMTPDGSILTSQWSPLASWRTDGSQLHGALTFVVPGAGSAEGAYEIRTGTAAGGTAIAKADVVASGFDAVVQVVSGGFTYTLSASDLLAGTVAPRQDYTHFAGPLAAEFVLGGALRVNGSGAEHPTLQAYFHVRAYGQPVARVHVTTVLENTGVFNTLGDVTGDVTISVGGATRYTNSGFPIGADRRYPKRFWWNGDPELWAQLDNEYLQDTKLVPEYRELTLDNDMLSSFPASIDWNERGSLPADMSAGGAAPFLAPLDRWSASYLISGDRRAFDGMRAYGDAYNWVVSKYNFAMNPRDENTGFAVNLADNPNLIGSGWDGPNAMAARRQSLAPLSTDMAHQPSCNYVLYLVTAEYGALEQCQMWGVANWVMERPGSYTGWPRSFFAGQVRAVGWGFRNIALAATATPDNHPLKGTLDDAVTFAIDSFGSDARPRDPNGDLGLWLTESAAQAIIYGSGSTPNPNDSGSNVGVATWQDDFLTWAMGFSYQLGYAPELNASAVWDWKAQSIVERLGDGSTYCWANGAAYALGVRDTEASALYPDWASVYSNNFPGAGACPGNGDADAGTDRSATDYGAQMGPAISVAVSSGIPGAGMGWLRYDARDVNWGSNTFERGPEWAMQPAAPSGTSGSPAATLQLAPDRTVITEGEIVTLSWSSTNATSCTASGDWQGPKPVSGSETTGPLLQNASFTLSCDGPGGGVTRSVSVFVEPPVPAPTVTFSASGTQVVAGASVTLTWSSTDAQDCQAFGDWSGTRALSGSESVGPLEVDSSFILQCSGAGGSAEQTVSVTVTTPPPTLSLSAAPTSIEAGEQSRLSWTSANASFCVASGDWGNIRPLIGSVNTGPLDSTATYTLTCNGPGGTAVESVTVAVSAPADAPLVTLSAQPSVVLPNAAATLSWTTQNADSCEASGGFSGARGTSGSESTGPLTSTTTYVLTCTGAGGTGSDSITVTVQPPPTLNLSVAPTTVNQGASATLSWSSAFATACEASGAWSGARGLSGSATTGALMATSTFTLTCSGPAGTIERSAVVTVRPQPTVTLSANPTAVASGGSSTLSWSTTNADQCTASGAWSGTRGTSGSASTGALSTSSVYTLTCSGAGGTAEDTVTVTVRPPPTLSLQASPTALNEGEAATLSWSSTNADSCTASGDWSGARATSGSASTGPLGMTSDFTLSCTGPGGSVDQTVTVSVRPAPTLNFSVSPATVNSGQSATLTWSTTNATSCSASGAWSGLRGTSGSDSTGALTSTSTFLLECTGDGGRVSDSVTVNVNSAPAPTLTFSGSPTTVMSGEAATLSWSSTNADACVASGAWSGNKGLSGSESTGALTASSTFTLSCSGASGAAEASVTINVDSGTGGTVIGAFTLTDSGGGAGRAVTFGLPIGEGVIGANTDLVVTRPDGQVLTSQWNKLASWRTDGTPLHGALTFLTPDAGDNSGTYQVRTGTPTAGTAISRMDVASSGFDATVQVTVGGTAYRLSAADLLGGTVTPRQDHTHFAGPLAAEFALGGPLRSGGTGAEHPTLQAYFHVRAFGRPVQRVYVTTVLENTGVFNTLANVTGDVEITVGGASVYTNNAFEVDADKRYPKRYWWNGDPGLWVQHDVEYIQDTKLVPEYREVTLSNSLLDGFPSSIEWDTRGQLASNLAGGGAGPHLAPLDRWSAAYLISGDRRAFDSMRAHGDAYHWVVSQFGYAMNPRDENTGYALNLASNTNLIGAGWGGANAMGARRLDTSPMQTDMAHQPSCNYALYLATAEYGALEHCQMWGVANWVMERPGSNPGWPRSFYTGQVRGVGWGYRNIVLAAVATPDAHPLKNTLEQAVTFAIDSFQADARPLDPNDNLGLWLTTGGANAVIYSSGTTPNPSDSGGDTGFAPWQDDFITFAIGFSHQLGYAAELDASGVWAWKAQAVVERLGDGNAYCWNSGAAFAMGIRNTSGSPFFTSWADVFSNNFPGAGTCPANGSDDAGTDRGPTDYGAQMGPAIAVAAASGIANAAAAWARYNQRVTNWGSLGFDDQPEWAVTP